MSVTYLRISMKRQLHRVCDQPIRKEEYKALDRWDKRYKMIFITNDGNDEYWCDVDGKRILLGP